MGQIACVTSIKGGVGKTVLAAGLTAAFVKMGFRVLAVDLDLGAGGLDIALGKTDTVGFTLPDLLHGQAKADSLVPSPDGVTFIPAPVSFGEDPFQGVEQEDFDRALSDLKERFDMVILDLPAGGGAAFPYLEKSGLVDRFLLVTTSAPTSVRAAERCAMRLREPEKAKLVLNAYRLSDPGDNSFPLTEIIRLSGVSIIGAVPYDREADRALLSGVPLTAWKKSRGGKAISNIALRLTGEEVPLFSGVLKGKKRLRFY